MLPFVLLLTLAVTSYVWAQEAAKEPNLTTESALPSDFKERLRQTVERSQAALEAADAHAGLIEVTEPGLPFGAIRGYDAAKVGADAEAIKTSLLSALADERLTGLRAYVDEFYPSVNLRSQEISRTEMMSCSIEPCPASLAEPSSVMETYRNIHQFTSKVRRATAYKISLDVKSVPDSALFTIQPVGGGLLTEIATNGSLGTLFRGLYRYRVERHGYKTATATLNLVDNTPRELVCTLVSTASEDEPLPCLFGVFE